MAIRLATEADIPLILRRLAELENPPNENAESIMRYLEEEIVVVDTALETICNILRNEGLTMFRVRWLLPENTSIALHAPLLVRSFTEAASRWSRDTGWRLEADFPQGRDADGNPDGGEGAVRAWQEYVRMAGVGDAKPFIGRSTTRDAHWLIWWTLGELVGKLALHV